jgi:hypothetical protein
MTEGVRLVRNGRVIAYLLPAAQYQSLVEHAAERPASEAAPPRELTKKQLDLLHRYSARKMTSTEAKVNLDVDRWGLVDLLGAHHLPLPRISRADAEQLVRLAFEPDHRDTDAKPNHVLIAREGTAPKKRRCDMIIMDASPLIYLAKAAALETLLHFNRRIFIADEVYHEACGRWLGADAASGLQTPACAVRIWELIESHPQHFVIVPTQLGELLREARKGGKDRVMHNAGEYTSATLYDNRLELTGSSKPVLVVYEDAELPRQFKSKDVHLLSTYGLMVALEQEGLVDSADALYEAIPQGERPARKVTDESNSGDTEYRSRLRPRKPG